MSRLIASTIFAACFLQLISAAAFSKEEIYGPVVGSRNGARLTAEDYIDLQKCSSTYMNGLRSLATAGNTRARDLYETRSRANVAVIAVALEACLSVMGRTNLKIEVGSGPATKGPKPDWDGPIAGTTLTPKRSQ